MFVVNEHYCNPLYLCACMRVSELGIIHAYVHILALFQHNTTAEPKYFGGEIFAVESNFFIS